MMMFTLVAKDMILVLHTEPGNCVANVRKGTRVTYVSHMCSQ